MNFAVIGLGYGDEGKGRIVHLLTILLKYQATVCRFNGGPQACHHDGYLKHHQTGSYGGNGVTSDDMHTYYSKYCFFNPGEFLQEKSLLEKYLSGWDNVEISFYAHPLTPMTTLYNEVTNQTTEKLRKQTNEEHGSCGFGIFEAFKCHNLGIAPLVGDTEEIIRSKLTKQAELYVDIESYIPHNYHDLFIYYWNKARESFSFADPWELSQEDGNIVFEGAQGYRIGMHTGEMPYCTPSDTSFGNVDLIVEEHDLEIPFKIGVHRTYSIRHGAGPLEHEIDKSTVLSMSLQKQEDTNPTNEWQGTARFGYFDVDRIVEIYKASGCDGLALTHVDTYEKLLADKVEIGYYNDGVLQHKDTTNMIADLEAKGVHVVIVSKGKTEGQALVTSEFKDNTYGKVASL